MPKGSTSGLVPVLHDGEGTAVSGTGPCHLPPACEGIDPTAEVRTDMVPLSLSQRGRSRLLEPQPAHSPARRASQQGTHRATISQVEQVGEDVVTQEVHALVDDRVDTQHRSALCLELPLPELLRVPAE